MRRKRLLWQLWPWYVLFAGLALAGVTWYASRTLRQVYTAQLSTNLNANARRVEEQVEAPFVREDWDWIRQQIPGLAHTAGARLTVIRPDGQVVGDSDEAPDRMMNHADRPEIRDALAGHAGSVTRWSPTLGQDMLYVAVPITDRGTVVGVVRAAVPLSAVNAAVRETTTKLAMAAVVAVVFTAVLALLTVSKISRRLREMKRVAQAFARGDLQRRCPVPDTEELRLLAQAMNQMAAELDGRLRTVMSQRNQLEALLSSMQDGVLAVDSRERIIILNDSAGRIMGVDPARAMGRSIQEVVRNSDIQRFVADSLAGRTAAPAEIVLGDAEEQFLDAHGTVLRDAQGRDIGAVIVLHDVTRLKQLENVRKEFVANVSHELKTPVTLIKGFMETLLDGQAHSPEDTQRFLGIVAKQADRLNSIIEDLLSLARLEQEGEQALPDLQVTPLRRILEAAVRECEAKARPRQIRLAVQCDDSLRAPVNAPLLEQAVINLVDNAIKYSEPGQPVEVGAVGNGSHVILHVRDFGCGIGKEHLSRIFERFYRVDKSRSRALGGTGLGLAIVKHIAQAHGGRVSVESTPGRGSTFYIRLPCGFPGFYPLPHG